MEKVRIVFNSEGFREILLSEGCHNLVTSVTEEIADVNVCMVKVMMELNISAGDVVDTMRWKAMRAKERMEGSDVSHCE